MSDAESDFSFDLDRQSSVKYYKKQPEDLPEKHELQVEPSTHQPAQNFIEEDYDVSDYDYDEDYLYEEYYKNSQSPSDAEQEIPSRSQSERARTIERPEVARQHSLVVQKGDRVITYFSPPVTPNRTNSATESLRTIEE